MKDFTLYDYPNSRDNLFHFLVYLRKITRSIGVFIFLGVFLVSFNTFSQVIIEGTVPVQTPTGGFGVDGDAFAGTPAPDFTDVGDWFFADPSDPNNDTNTDPGGLFQFDNVNGTLIPLYDNTFFQQDDIPMGKTKDRTIFTTDAKIDHDPNTYTWGEGSSPPKNEIQNVAVHFTYGDASLSDDFGTFGNPDDLWALFGADRAVNNGDSYIDFEFLQASLTMTGIGTGSGGFESDPSTAATGGRTIGDLLITVGYGNGGGVATVAVFRWSPDGSGGYYYALQNLSNYMGMIYATTNTSISYVPFDAYGKNYYEVNQWVEGAVNLSGIFEENLDPCIELSTLFVRTRSSGESGTAQLKDFPLEPIQLHLDLTPPAPELADIDNCGTWEGTLEATGCEGTVKWYDAETEGTLLHTGASYELTGEDAITETTSFWMSCTVDGCEGPRAEVKVTIYANPDAGISTDGVCVGDDSVFKATPANGDNFLFFEDANDDGAYVLADDGVALQNGTSDTYTGAHAHDTKIGVVVTYENEDLNCSDTAVTTAKVIDNPAALVLTGSSICTSITGTGSITSSTSVVGVSYQLYDSSDATVQTAQAGTGSGLTWSNVAAGTGYYAIATGAAPTSCTSKSNAVDVIEVPNPAALVLTGSSICTSVTGTGSITSSTSVVGVSYQLYDSANATVQTAQAGTGSGLTWSNVAAGTGYYAIATGAAPTSCTSQSNAVSVIEVPNPAALVLTGSSICTSITGTGSITSSTSVVGVSYQLYDSSDATVQTAQAGTGSGLTWSNVAAGTGYYAIATGAAPTSCTSQSNAVSVIEVPNPAALVLTGSSICTSVTGTGSITSSTSVVGVSYQLYDSANATVQTAQAGTGSGLTWSNVAAGTGYYAIATGAAPTSCTSQSNAVSVIEVPNPAALVLTGSSICTSVSGTGSITSSTSVVGVSYQLYDSANATVQTAQAGTGSGLTWSNVAAGTGYYAIATGAAPTSCTSQSNAVSVIEVPNPAALVLTGSSICTSVSGTGSITSSTSVVGVSYQLYDSANATVQTAQAGTGSGLTWSNVAAGTGYYAIATGAAPTSCTSQSNAVSVIEVPNPAALVLTGSSICTSVSGTGSITSSTSVVGVSYQLYDSANATVQTAQAGTGSGLTWSNVAAGTGYYAIATGAAPTSCTSQSNAVSVIEVPNPAALVLTGSLICDSAPGTGTVSSTTSELGVSYQLRIGLVDVQSAKAGTGAALIWTGLNAGVNYNVVSTGAAPTNCLGSSNNVNVATENCITDEGCTPGYWKNHTDAWVGAHPDDNFFTHFGITSIGDNVQDITTECDLNHDGQLTLLEAISAEIKTSKNNGWFAALARHAVAAFLNASNPSVGYEFSTSYILAQTKLVFETDYPNRNQANAAARALHDMFRTANERVCPLGNGTSSTLADTSVLRLSESTVEIQAEELNQNTTDVNSFSVSPVPFRESLSVRYDFDYVSSALIQMFDMQGRLLLTQKEANASQGKITDLNINFRIMPSQVYVIKVTTDRDVFTKKIISDK